MAGEKNTRRECELGGFEIPMVLGIGLGEHVLVVRIASVMGCNKIFKVQFNLLSKKRTFWYQKKQVYFMFIH